MRNSIFSLFIVVISAMPAISVAEPLKCSVSLADSITYQTFRPITDFGRAFSNFFIDLSQSPDEGWQHQNMCINRNDFRGARFAGSLCLIVMSTRSSALPTATPALYISVWQGKPHKVTEPRVAQKGISLSRRSFSDVELVIPIHSNAEEVRWRQSFKVIGARDLASLEIACSKQ